MGRSHTHLLLAQPSLRSQLAENRSMRFPAPGRRRAQGMLAIAAACTFLAAGSFFRPTARAATSALTHAEMDSSVDQRLLAPELLAQVTYPTLSAGSTGASVSRLQATLKLLGFYQGAVDGIYAQATQAAVGRFQAAAGIATDGVTGPSTWAKLLPSPDAVAAASEQTGAPDEPSDPPPASAPADPPAASAPTPPTANTPPVLRLQAEGSAVSQLQRELQTLGYYSGTIDGVFGQQTQAAVTRFQTEKKLTVDGVVGASTWEALTRALAQSAG